MLPKLRRGNKIHPCYTAEQTKTFKQMWAETELKIKANPFKLNSAIFCEEKETEPETETEKYAWVDELLEEMHVHTEDEDDEEKNKITFSAWSSDKINEQKNQK